MSRKISNILVICAMVVIFPLLVIGSAFAAYYSINASVKVAIYADVTNDTATITLSSGAKDYSEDFELAGSHVSEVTVRAKSVGYDFVGWYNGTAEQYEADIDKKFISEEDVFKAKLSDYENVLAVFNIKRFAVSYEYNADPTNAADKTTTAPTAENTTNNVDGKNVYNYGEVLPMLKTVNHHTFKGWVVNNVIYKRAIFTAAEEYKLEATKANGAWVENETTVITYKVNDQTITEESSTYANEDFDLPAIEEVRSVENDELTGYKVTINGNDIPLSMPENGKRWAWVDANNAEVTKVSQNTTVTLKKVDVRYTINVVSGQDISYKNNPNMSFKYSELNLTNIFNVDNYEKDYSFWTLGDISYVGTPYTEKDALVNKIKEDNPHNDATITLTANVKKYFEQVSVTSITFKSANPEDDNQFTGTTYIISGGEFDEFSLTVEKTASTATIAEWINFEGRTFYSVENDYSSEVSPFAINVTYNGLGAQILLENVNTINDIMEILYNKNKILVELDEEISVTVEIYLE